MNCNGWLTNHNISGLYQGGARKFAFALGLKFKQIGRAAKILVAGGIERADSQIGGARNLSAG